MIKNLRFAIAGTGAISGHFARSLEEIQDVELVAVCSSGPGRATEAEKRFLRPVYTDLHLMISEKKPDVLCVCTASGSHLDAAKIAASAGVHVLCEKPLEINTARVDEMIRVCADHAVLLGCIFQNRLNPDFVRARRILESGEIGKLLTVQANIPWYRTPEYYSTSPWRGTLKLDGGGALINQGIHTIDLLSLIGGPVKQVSGRVKTVVHAIEGEDLAVAWIDFENGALGQIQASTGMWPGQPEQLAMYGDGGYLILEGGVLISARSKWNTNIDIQNKPSETSTGASNPMSIGYHLHKEQIQDFANAVRGGVAPMIPGAEARKAVAIIEAIYRSSKQGGAPVSLF